MLSTYSPEEIKNTLVDFVLNKGILKYDLIGHLVHMPFTLLPYEIQNDSIIYLERLTILFQKLAVAIVRDPSFLRESLALVAQADPFVAKLLALEKGYLNQPDQLLISRSDYFFDEKNHPKQVELNTISVGFLSSSDKLTEMYHFAHDRFGSSKPINNPIMETLIDGFQQVHQHYGYSDAHVLMVVQPNERNIFDQRGIEYALLQKHGIRLIRASLAEIASQGYLHEGHLFFKNQRISIAYFRAAYGPEDFTSELAFVGRRLIDESSVIQAPSMGLQLVGLKKIQQILTQPKILRQFLSEEDSLTLESSFVKIHSLSEVLIPQQVTAAEWASQHPQNYVLKPQREGGGHNFYDNAIPPQLTSLTPHERQGYILMERILPSSYGNTLITNHQSTEALCVSEVGQYGFCFFGKNKIYSNKNLGYLVRTKPSHYNEGGVSAGYAGLSSLSVKPSSSDKF